MAYHNKHRISTWGNYGHRDENMRLIMGKLPGYTILQSFITFVVNQLDIFPTGAHGTARPPLLLGLFTTYSAYSPLLVLVCRLLLSD